MFCHTNRIANSTFYEWVKLYPDFSNAFREGRKDALGHWEHFCVSHFENTKFNTNLFKLFMSNCFGWSEKRETENNVNLREDSARQVRDVKKVHV